MWLSVYLPLLPLEALDLYQENQHQLITSSIAVVKNNIIICVNPQASSEGIKINQSLTKAYTINPEIKILKCNQQQEQQYLNQLALLIYNYSPNITVEIEGFFLVEISRSLKLFGSLEQLLSSLTRVLSNKKITFQVTTGETPESAKLFSIETAGITITNQTSIQRMKQNETVDNKMEKLHYLPITLLQLPEKSIEQILSVGIRKIGELAKLPDKAIRQRFGKTVSLYLKKLYGKFPDPREYFYPEDCFFQKLEFIDVIYHRQGLLFPIKRLIDHLCHFLRVKQKHCQSLHWELSDSEKNTIHFDVQLSENQISLKTGVELTQLNLERYTLHAPIEAISLTATQLSELNINNQQLFEQQNNFIQETVFIDKIKARLGVKSCYHLQQKMEQAPELASQKITHTPPANIYSNKIASNTDKREEHQKNNAIHRHNTCRPSWLFKAPKPIHFNQGKFLWHGELKIISSQERITQHWWKKKIARDYFIAEHDNGTLYWMFFDHIEQHWYLHGIFS